MARAKPKFSIITACKGRLEHLKQTLPAMLAQKDSEVIVVDYSCPESTADYVSANFPDAKVVRIENEEGFSNWKARNAGAKEAQGEFLIFCDADTILAPHAVDEIGKTIDENSFGFFTLEETNKFMVPGARLSMNQLKGFHVIPADLFTKMEGYDEAMTGYAAGADTDIEDRLRIAQVEHRGLPSGIVQDVIKHDDKERVRFHRQPVGFSYAAGLLYRRAKLAMMLINRRTNIKPAMSEALAKASKGAAKKLVTTGEASHINVIVADEPLRMPVQLGLKDGRLRITMKLEIIPGERLQVVRQKPKA